MADRDGKWTCSDNEERWTCGEEFDTREEALAYALGPLAEERNIEDGGRVYVGQIKMVTVEQLADAACPRIDSVMDGISEWLHENVGKDFSDEFTSTKEQDADLENRLTATIREWIVEHKLQPKVFTLDHVTSHAFEQCGQWANREAQP